MNLVRWNPWRGMSTVHNPLHRLFDDPFLSTAWFDSESGLRGWKPAVDIYEEDSKIILKAELPGVDKNDIDVDVKDRVLTLKGERSYENEVKEDRYHRKEQAYGSFHRSFTLPDDVDSAKIKADYKDGILKIEIPKPEERKPKKITIH